jgi:pimeloyl-ACP methyl ester carboxylesterase
MTAWRQTRPNISPHLEELVKTYPDYQLTLVGHSLGGAVAALASLEFHAQGWEPQVTTFGEPRIGNFNLMQYINRAFAPETKANTTNMYRRVTHAEDPVPLLPLSEWGYNMHAGEIYISKKELPPSVSDIRHCEGDQDLNCIAGLESSIAHQLIQENDIEVDDKKFPGWLNHGKGILRVPMRFRVWQLFLAHRDYFWRLGLCVPGGDPTSSIGNTRRLESDFIDK